MKTHNPIHDIREFGAVGDGATVNTGAIQKAIDTSLNFGIQLDDNPSV